MGSKSSKQRASLETSGSDWARKREAEDAPEFRSTIVTHVQQLLADSRTLHAMTNWTISTGGHPEDGGVVEDRRVNPHGSASDRSRNPYDQEPSKRKRRTDRS